MPGARVAGAAILAGVMLTIKGDTPDKPCPKASESTPGTPDPDEEEKIRHRVFEPDDLFEIVEEGEVVGTIKYKHIPRGALIHEFPAPKGPIRGQVLVGEIQGGAIGDLFNLQVF